MNKEQIRKEERIEALEEAEALLIEVIALIGDAVEGTNAEAAAKVYTIPHLKSWIGEGNPYTTGTIPELLEILERNG